MADALLRVDGWTPDVLLSPELLGEAGQGAVLVRSYAAMEHRGGWNSAWGLPKDTEPAVRAGGVYLYQVPNDTDLSGRLEALRALEKSGVGERRQEGFGQVRVCDPFHVKMIQRGEEAER
jgi:CRISPR-associated protein Csx10